MKICGSSIHFVHVVRLHLRCSKLTQLIFFKGTPTRGIREELTVVVIIMRPWPFISPVHLCDGSAKSTGWLIFCGARSFDKSEHAQWASNCAEWLFSLWLKLLINHRTNPIPAGLSILTVPIWTFDKETRRERERDRTQLPHWIDSYLCSDSLIRD